MAQQLVGPYGYTLPFTTEVALATDALHQRLKNVIPDVEWELFAPYIARINQLKAERGVVILAHNYQTPEIFHGVADIVGDSLALAREAAKSTAETILVCGVHFMAETAKVLNPDRTVLIPDLEAGCSLASSITAADVRLIRERHPGVPIVTYVNTSAAVKAESDICCTSGNVVELVKSLNVPRVICIPDKFLASYVAAQTGIEVITWEGSCEVHELFTAADIDNFRKGHPGVVVLAHPECPEDVVAAADFTGSTAHMIQYVDEHKPQRVVLITECSMSDNVAINFPDLEFVRPCNLCPHMKRITLPKILHSLETMTYAVEVAADVSARARMAVERMLAIGAK
jgi:quinolinate synthase